MAAKRRLSEELDDFERALATLSPCVRGVDRDQLMFLAGKMASAEQTPAFAGSTRRLWPAATAASTIVAAVLGILFVAQIGREPVRQRTNIVQELASDEEALSKDAADGVTDGADQETPDPFLDVASGGQLADGRLAQPDYMRLRRTALTDGVEALPLPTHSASLDAEPPVSYWKSTQPLRDERANKYPRRNSNLLDSTLFFGFGEKL